MRSVFRWPLLMTAFCAVVAQGQSAPGSADFMKALEKSLLRLVPMGFDERQVLFSNVRQGRGGGGAWAFQADVVIRDYDAGYPPNGYFGETCISRMDEARFTMVQDDFGDWAVQGALTPRSSQCTRNPSQGVSSVPLSTLPGAQASQAPPPPTPTAASAPATRAPAAASGGAAPRTAPSNPAARGPATGLVGEYACYGRGGQLMAGMGFRLEASGRYTDVDGGRAGRYQHDAAAGSLSFAGGFLGGQSARRSGGLGFRFTNMVSCEPYRR